MPGPGDVFRVQPVEPGGPHGRRHRVMNRVESPRFPSTICGVVAQHRQFAPGVLSRAVDARQAGPAQSDANAVRKGERYAPVGKAMHFHMASFNNPYPARYVAVAGGNAFYLKSCLLYTSPSP